MGDTIDVDGHRIRVTHLDKVLYPASGTRKAEVLGHYNLVADVMLPRLARRPVTRKRWPDGVESASFFEKQIPVGAPEWLPQIRITHSTRTAAYPIIDSRAALLWCAQQSALELHIPQWQYGGDPSTAIRITDQHTSLLVIDLDPGPDVSLTGCAQVALAANELLTGAGMTGYPVTSGSSGIHIYVPLPQPVPWASARSVAHHIAETLADESPHSVTTTMAKTARIGKVFIDWTQNNGAKTTVAPYSLRGRARPTVAAPRTWAELHDPELAQIDIADMPARLDSYGDLLAGLLDTQPQRPSAVVALSEYRRKRDTARTPEPSADSVVNNSDSRSIFVIQEHHARRLHYDFRLERDGVLASWAVPKNLPIDSGSNRLAVQTEDHPMAYATFHGDIPAGEYGGGHVKIYDYGTYETEKWRSDEIIVRLHGSRIEGRYALIRTDGSQWLAHRMSDGHRPPLPRQLRSPSPMLATEAPIDALPDDDWAFEGKWDGYRAIVEYLGSQLTLRSRRGIDITADFVELHHLADDLGDIDVILDGEIVAIDSSGTTNFGLLAGRENTDEPYSLRYYAFDILYVRGSSTLRLPWRDRRALLDELEPLFATSTSVVIPPLLSGVGSQALTTSRERGWEGVIAKRRSSTYQQGRRSTMWRKHKNWNDVDVVIGGWRAGNGARGSSLGSLLVGLPEPSGLRYVGRVGTGFTDQQLTALRTELTPLHRASSPFIPPMDAEISADAHWVTPTLIAHVRFLNWTDSGLLRHASWRGIRRDITPDEL